MRLPEVSSADGTVERVLLARHSPASYDSHGSCVSPGYRTDPGPGGTVRVDHRMPERDLLDANRTSDDDMAAEPHRKVDAYAATLTTANWTVERRGQHSRKPYLLARPPARKLLPRLLTATPYVDWLVRVLREAADEERAALHAARLPTAVTIPVTVVRHQCPHCRRTWAKQPAAAAHVARCWLNPEVRSCKTCEHHDPGEAAGGCGDRYCNCYEIPEGCNIGAATPMITDCPLWQPADGE